MGERKAEKPNRDEEATRTPAAAGSNCDRQACRGKEKQGCAGVPGPSAWASWEGLERERDSGPVGAGATRGLGHSWSGRGGWVGEGRTA